MHFIHSTIVSPVANCSSAFLVCPGRLPHAQPPAVRRRAGPAREHRACGQLDPARNPVAEAAADRPERLGSIWPVHVWQCVEGGESVDSGCNGMGDWSGLLLGSNRRWLIVLTVLID